MFLGKYNLIAVEKKMSNFNGDIETYSDVYYNEEHSDDSDDSDEENSNNKIGIKKIKSINLFLEKIKKYGKFIFWKYIF